MIDPPQECPGYGIYTYIRGREGGGGGEEEEEEVFAGRSKWRCHLAHIADVFGNASVQRSNISRSCVVPKTPHLRTCAWNCRQ